MDPCCAGWDSANCGMEWGTWNKNCSFHCDCKLHFHYIRPNQDWLRPKIAQTLYITQSLERWYIDKYSQGNRGDRFDVQINKLMWYLTNGRGFTLPLQDVEDTICR